MVEETTLNPTTGRACASVSDFSEFALGYGTNQYSADSDGATVDNQTVSQGSDFTVDVLAAIELMPPGDDQDAKAPVAGGASNAEAILETGSDIRSNLSWQVETTLSNPALQGGSTGTRGLIAALDLSGSSDSGTRNTSNRAQEYDALYSQSISWGDEAGAYQVTATHTATQTLGD